MTENNFTKRYDEYHRLFGGYVHNCDYDEYRSISDVAAEIIMDMKINEKLRKNIEKRNEKKNVHL